MSETIQSISQGTYTIGQTSATNFVAGPGIVIDEPSAGTVRIGNDETVLWESSTGTSTYTTPNIVLTDNPFNYEYLEIYCSYQGPFQVSKKIQTSYITSNGNEFGIGDFCGDSPNTDALYIRDTWFKVNTRAISAYKATQAVVMNNAISQQGSSQYAYVTLYKVIGINRKEV